MATVSPEVSTTILIALGAYLAIVLIVGIVLERLVKTLSDYILGGRRLGPYVIGFSERASEMSGWVGLGLPGEGFSSGVNATWNTIGCFYADLICWTLIAKRLRRYTEVVGALTIPAYLEARFNDTKGVLRLTAAIIITIFLTAYVGAQFTASGKLFAAIMGGGAITTWIAIGALIMIIYTVLGGFFAVCWTDYIQGWWAFIGLLIIAAVGYSKYGGIGGLFSKMAEVDPKLVSLNNFWGWEYSGVLLLVIILSYLAIGFGWPGNVHIIVRFMGIKSVRDLKKAAITAMLLLLVVYYLAISVGWFAKVEFREAKNLIVADPEFSLQTLAINWLPPVLAGMVLAAPLALMMSTADSQLLVTASAIVEDIYHRFISREIEEKKLVLISRIVTFVLGIIALIWALFFGESVYLFVLFAWGGLGAAFGPIMLMSLWWRRLTATGAFACMVTGATGIIIWKSYVKKLIFPTVEAMNANWWVIAILLPIITFILVLIGGSILEGDLGKGLKAATVTAVVNAIVWIPWCYARLVADPKLAAWWYELLIAFPLAMLIAYVVSLVTTPLPEEFVNKTFEYMTKPTEGEVREATSEKPKTTAIVTLRELDIVKNFIKINSLA